MTRAKHLAKKRNNELSRNSEFSSKIDVYTNRDSRGRGSIQSYPISTISTHMKSNIFSLERNYFANHALLDI